MTSDRDSARVLPHAIDAESEDEAWEKVNALMRDRLGEGTPELPSGVRSWTMYEDC